MSHLDSRTVTLSGLEAEESGLRTELRAAGEVAEHLSLLRRVLANQDEQIRIQEELPGRAFYKHRALIRLRASREASCLAIEIDQARTRAEQAGQTLPNPWQYLDAQSLDPDSLVMVLTALSAVYRATAPR